MLQCLHRVSSIECNPDVAYIETILTSQQCDWLQEIIINECPFSFKLYTGAQVNVQPLSVIQKLKNHPTSLEVCTYTGATLPVSVDVYVTQLKTLAASCEFGDQEESIIRDRVVLGVNNRTLQERLMREPDLSVRNAADYIRAVETSQEQLKTISDFPEIKVEVDAVRAKMGHSSKSESVFNAGRSNNFHCNICGNIHGRRECPAYNRLCSICKKKIILLPCVE
ncbi:hypothetical protein AVEN_125813-1 [Araneus ventricosus]|uniref:CCHC-type domain-containing protein n=1 Tax=Araneus ventricosus TaxID=182803 RepID=A0A4Y2RXD1_ARAVE|nr:hypothetical protein AVEN_125813-1 [Araneus ventricosus]